MMDMIRADLDLLGIRHDVYFSEKSLQSEGRDRVAEAIDALSGRDLIYQGKLPPPKGGQPPEDWEDREQTLFRSTKFGDDVDRALMKSDGSYTYFASDIAYHYDKYIRGYLDQVDVFGADHGGYVKRMKAAVQAMSGSEAVLEIQLVQLVRLLRGGKPVAMGKRTGNLITLREVVEEVGRDAVRFMMMYRKADAPLDFLGWQPELGTRSLPDRTAAALVKVPPVMLGVAGLMTGIYWTIGRRMKIAAEAEAAAAQAGTEDKGAEVANG